MKQVGRHRVLQGSALLLAVFALTGCSGNDDSSGKATEKPGPPANGQAAPTAVPPGGNTSMKPQTGNLDTSK